MTQRDAFGRRYAEQIGNAPDQIVLELRSRAVGISDRPHHLDQAQPLAFVERSVEQTGEMIEIDRLFIGDRGLFDQLARSEEHTSETPVTDQSRMPSSA